MKIPKSYLKYFKKIEKNIVGVLQMPSENFAKEDYHKLRVEIKKLNAVLTSLEFCFKSFKKERYQKGLQQLFKQAGKVRNYQLEESSLRTNPVPQYLSDLAKTIEKEKIKFAALHDKLHIKKIKKTFKKIERFIKKMHRKDLQKFVENERNKIRHFFQKDALLPGNLHAMRKLLKIDFYTRKITDQPVAENLVEEENTFLELLGQWHDCQTMNRLLQKSIFKGVRSAEELHDLSKMNAEIKGTSDNLLKDIKERMQKGVYL